MQERLLQIGDWMNINSEAIYNTVRWKTTSQWSEGNRDYKAKKGDNDLLLKITVNPDPGYAVKEIFYTYNPTSNSLYAIFPRYPANKKLVLKDIQLPKGTQINFLATRKNVQWRQQGKNVVVTLPDYDPEAMKAPYAYVVKIEGYGK